MFRPLSSVIHYIYDVIQLTVDPSPVNHLENGSISDTSNGHTDKPGRDHIVLDMATQIQIPQIQLTNCRKRVCVPKEP